MENQKSNNGQRKAAENYEEQQKAKNGHRSWKNQNGQQKAQKAQMETRLKQNSNG